MASRGVLFSKPAANRIVSATKFVEQTRRGVPSNPLNAIRDYGDIRMARITRIESAGSGSGDGSGSISASSDAQCQSAVVEVELIKAVFDESVGTSVLTTSRVIGGEVLQAAVPSHITPAVDLIVKIARTSGRWWVDADYGICPGIDESGSGSSSGSGSVSVSIPDTSGDGSGGSGTGSSGSTSGSGSSSSTSGTPTSGTSSSSSSSSSSSQSTIQCNSCDIAPYAWKVTLSGITDDSCSDCETWNRQYTLTFVPVMGNVCLWEETVSLGCSVTKAQFSIIGGTAQFSLHTTVAIVSWSLSVDVDCFGPNVLTFDSDLGQCQNHPATITVSPA